MMPTPPLDPFIAMQFEPKMESDSSSINKIINNKNKFDMIRPKTLVDKAPGAHEDHHNDDARNHRVNDIEFHRHINSEIENLTDEVEPDESKSNDNDNIDGDLSLLFHPRNSNSSPNVMRGF